MVKKEPFLACEKKDTDKYLKLSRRKMSPFYQRSYADIFLFAIALAIHNGLSPMKLKNRNPNIPLSAFGNKVWILNTVAIAEKKTHKALFNPLEVYRLAEEYANAGIKQLYDEIFEKAGDFHKKIEGWIKKYSK